MSQNFETIIINNEPIPRREVVNTLISFAAASLCSPETVQAEGEVTNKHKDSTPKELTKEERFEQMQRTEKIFKKEQEIQEIQERLFEKNLEVIEILEKEPELKKEIENFATDLKENKDIGLEINWKGIVTVFMAWYVSVMTVFLGRAKLEDFLDDNFPTREGFAGPTSALSFIFIAIITLVAFGSVPLFSSYLENRFSNSIFKKHGQFSNEIVEMIKELKLRKKELNELKSNQ